MARELERLENEVMEIESLYDDFDGKLSALTNVYKSKTQTARDEGEGIDHEEDGLFHLITRISEYKHIVGLLRAHEKFNNVLYVWEAYEFSRKHEIVIHSKIFQYFDRCAKNLDNEVKYFFRCDSEGLKRDSKRGLSARLSDVFQLKTLGRGDSVSRLGIINDKAIARASLRMVKEREELVRGMSREEILCDAVACANQIFNKNFSLEQFERLLKESVGE